MTNKKVRQALQATLDMEADHGRGLRAQGLHPPGSQHLLPGAGLALDGCRRRYTTRHDQRQGPAAAQGGRLRHASRALGDRRRNTSSCTRTRSSPSSRWRTVGFVVDLQVVDWATLNARAEKPELWEIASTGFVFSADPANHRRVPLHVLGGRGVQTRTRSGWSPTCAPESDPKKKKRKGPSSSACRPIFYEDVGSRGSWATTSTLDAARRELRGGVPHGPPRMYFWNTWLSR